MLRTVLCIVAAGWLSFARGADDVKVLIDKTAGDVSKVVVDVAPGTVSAMSLLGIGAEETTVVQNPRNLTVALRAFDGKNAFGIALTPARTSLMPMSVSEYNASSLKRIWAATTFSYAQGRAQSAGLDYDRRAVAVESSYFFFPHTDDPLVMYWDALEEAARHPNDVTNVCLIQNEAVPPAQPAGAAPPTATTNTAMVEITELNAKWDKRAQACRERVEKSARWNVSRAWASWAGGDYQRATGGDSHSLGQTIVLGATLGLGGAEARTAAALTAAVKRIANSPLLTSLGDPQPVRTNSNLATFRLAVGSSWIRALLEASKAHNDEPTAAGRVFKRALGIDLRIAEGWWLNVRAGKQRRIDNSGEENGSSFSLSYSPKALLEL